MKDHFGQKVGRNHKRFLENIFLKLPFPLPGPPWCCECEKHGESGFLGPPGFWPSQDGAFDHNSSFTSCLMGLWATLYQQSINTIDLHVPGNAVLLGRRVSWLHFCIKGSDYITGCLAFQHVGLINSDTIVKEVGLEVLRVKLFQRTQVTSQTPRYFMRSYKVLRDTTAL